MNTPKPKGAFLVEGESGTYNTWVIYLPKMATAVERLIDIPGVIGVEIAGKAIIRTHRLYNHHEVDEAIRASLQDALDELEGKND